MLASLRVVPFFPYMHARGQMVHTIRPNALVLGCVLGNLSKNEKTTYNSCSTENLGSLAKHTKHKQYSLQV